MLFHLKTYSSSHCKINWPVTELCLCRHVEWGRLVGERLYGYNKIVVSCSFVMKLLNFVRLLGRVYTKDPLHATRNTAQHATQQTYVITVHSKLTVEASGSQTSSFCGAHGCHVALCETSIPYLYIMWHNGWKRNSGMRRGGCLLGNGPCCQPVNIRAQKIKNHNC